MNNSLENEIREILDDPNYAFGMREKRKDQFAGVVANLFTRRMEAFADSLLRDLDIRSDYAPLLTDIPKKIRTYMSGEILIAVEKSLARHLGKEGSND